MKTTYVKDLKDQINTTAPRELFHCLHCGGEYSANRGDYFSIAPDCPLTCCGAPLQLVIKRVVYTITGGRK